MENNKFESDERPLISFFRRQTSDRIETISWKFRINLEVFKINFAEIV